MNKKINSKYFTGYKEKMASMVTQKIVFVNKKALV